MGKKANKKSRDKETKKKYEKPVLKVFTNKEIDEEFGPAHACSPSPCPLNP